MYDTSDERDEEYEAEEKRLQKEDEEKGKARKVGKCNGCVDWIKVKCRELDASRGVIVAIVLMTCVFIVAIVFANRYNKIVADIEAHFNDTEAAREVGR